MKTINIEKLFSRKLTKAEYAYVDGNTRLLFLTNDMLPAGCEYKRKKWSWDIVEVTLKDKKQEEAFAKVVEKRVKALKGKAKAGIAKAKADAKNREKARKEREAWEKKIAREEAAINAVTEGGSFRSLVYSLRTGEHIDGINARWSAVSNDITCVEMSDWNGYSKKCKYPMVSRTFTLHIRKGWHVFRIGGLITFVKGGKIVREGMACEWIEQGKAISDIHTVSGYLVRGEHIVADSLKEAKAINAEHRAMQLARVLSARKKAERRAEQMANGTLRITFQDSLNAGNCRPGTSEFKHKYEEAVGHEVKYISIADLRKYGKLFGVEYYAEKAIQYALNH